MKNSTLQTKYCSRVISKNPFYLFLCLLSSVGKYHLSFPPEQCRVAGRNKTVIGIWNEIPPSFSLCLSYILSNVAAAEQKTQTVVARTSDLLPLLSFLPSSKFPHKLSSFFCKCTYTTGLGKYIETAKRFAEIWWYLSYQNIWII